MSGLIAVFYFLFSLMFSLVTFALWIRVALSYFKISALHPISHMVNTLTDPILRPITSITKITHKRSKRYDWPTLAVIVIITVLKFVLINVFFLAHSMPFILIFIYTAASLVVEPCNILFYAMLARAILSWVNPTWQHPIAELLYIITEPMLKRIRNFIPALAGLDFSPLVGMIALKIPAIFIGTMLPLNLL